MTTSEDSTSEDSNLPVVLDGCIMGVFRACVGHLAMPCRILWRRSVALYIIVALVVIFLVLDLLSTQPVNLNELQDGRSVSSTADLDVRFGSSNPNPETSHPLRPNSSWSHFLNSSLWNLLPIIGNTSMPRNIPNSTDRKGLSYSLFMGPGMGSSDFAEKYTSMYTDTADNTDDVTQEPDENEADDGSSLHLLVLGDWGGNDGFPYTSEIQLAVAASMQELAKSTRIHGVISPGDNFYENGVVNLEDPHFNATFEQVYRGPLLRMPWFTLAGNHDYLGNVSAQISYTNSSERWYFPWYNYHLSWDLNGPSGDAKVTFIMVDTILLCGNCGLEDALDPPMGPSDPQLADDIWMWFEDMLIQASDVDHLIVVGHFPVLSGGLHGPTICLEDRMLPLLHKYKVNAYITGHDHNMQHIFSSSVDYGWDVDHYVVGSGAKVETRRRYLDEIPDHQLLFYNDEVRLEQGAGGFALLDMDAASMNFTFYNSKGHPLHRHSTHTKRRGNTLIFN